MSNSKTIGTEGTKEWADSNVNIQKGCPNNCRYCYAKWMAYRFGRIEDPKEWTQIKMVQDKIKKGYRKRKGRIMFPTTHDITEDNIDECITVLRKMLDAGNEVLITTKPRLKCIFYIIKELGEFKDLIQFRFTITSAHSEMLSKWEPNAPDLPERIAALTKAYQAGFKTSVSIEPFLDWDPIPLIEMIGSLCTESIWLGLMNQRFMYFYSIPKGFEDRYRIDNIMRIILDYHRRLPAEISNKMRLKDSIKNLIHMHKQGSILEEEKSNV
jgi:hypothetical protein